MGISCDIEPAEGLRSLEREMGCKVWNPSKLRVFRCKFYFGVNGYIHLRKCGFSTMFTSVDDQRIEN